MVNNFNFLHCLKVIRFTFIFDFNKSSIHVLSSMVYIKESVRECIIKKITEGGIVMNEWNE